MLRYARSANPDTLDLRPTLQRLLALADSVDDPAIIAAVLSACETARGAYDAAERVIGLPWAFLAAGTPAVVVSHWKVASTARRS